MLASSSKAAPTEDRSHTCLSRCLLEFIPSSLSQGRWPWDIMPWQYMQPLTNQSRTLCLQPGLVTEANEWLGVCAHLVCMVNSMSAWAIMRGLASKNQVSLLKEYKPFWQSFLQHTEKALVSVSTRAGTRAEWKVSSSIALIPLRQGFSLN